MKVDNNLSYPILNNMHKPKYGLEDKQKYVQAQLCGDMCENVNRGYYSGSSVSFGSAAKFSLEKLIDACNHHTTIVQNLVALVLAVGPRPLAILSLPGKKNKEDKIYASGHSMASGLIGFAFASVVMYPLGQAAKKVRQDAQKILDKIDASNDVKFVTRKLAKLAKEENIPEEKLTAKSLLEGTSHLDGNFLKQFGSYEEKDGKLTKLTSIDKNKDFTKVYNDYNLKNMSKSKLLEGTKFIKEKFVNMFADFDAKGQFIKLNKKLDFDMVYKAVNMAPDVFVFGILKAMLTVALIPPILKHVFGLEKSKPAQAQPQKEPASQSQVKDTVKASGEKVDGGNK